MKTKIASSFLFCLLALGLGAQITETPEPALPTDPVTTVEFEDETFDFGTVEQGEIVTKVFTFTNTGEQPLIIYSARGSCGCTIPEWPKDPILRGETASITVEFDTKGKIGLQSKKVTITANTDPQQIFLYLNGEVLAADGTITDDSEAEEEAPVVQPDCFVIEPNPTAEILSLRMGESRVGKPVTVGIFSPSGQLMAQRHIAEAPSVIQFEVSHYPAGLYIARMKTDKGEGESHCFVVSR